MKLGLLTHDEKQKRWEEHQSARVCSDTPVIKAFLDRPDVKTLIFPSRYVHVFVGDRPFVGRTLQEAVELAMKATL